LFLVLYLKGFPLDIFASSYLIAMDKNTFLFVDDSEFIFNRLIDLLGDLDAKKLNTARTFTEVAATLEQNNSDIILLNTDSLESNELVLLSILKDLYPQVSITILSGNYNKYYLDQWKKIGAGYFIEKVSDIDNIREVENFKKKIPDALAA